MPCPHFITPGPSNVATWNLASTRCSASPCLTVRGVSRTAGAVPVRDLTSYCIARIRADRSNGFERRVSTRLRSPELRLRRQLAPARLGAFRFTPRPLRLRSWPRVGSDTTGSHHRRARLTPPPAFPSAPPGWSRCEGSQASRRPTGVVSSPGGFDLLGPRLCQSFTLARPPETSDLSMIKAYGVPPGIKGIPSSSARMAPLETIGELGWPCGRSV